MSHSTRPMFDKVAAAAKIKAAGLSVAAVARSLGYERQTVGHWLRGRGEPDMRQLHAMATAIGCHWLELVNADATVVNDDLERLRIERIRSLSAEKLALIDAMLRTMAD